MRTVIIGGVAGGMSAATRLRRLDESREIVVLERGPAVSFANCGLPYYVGGVIEKRSSLILQTPESLASRFRLDVRVHHEATAIDTALKTVSVTDLSTGMTSELGYDSLVLATGAAANAQDDAELTGTQAHGLRTLDDVDAVTAALASIPGQAEVLVVGAGFIGLEAVENLLHRGALVTLVNRGPHVLPTLDTEMASPIADALIAAGVRLRTNTTVASHRDGIVTLSTGEQLRPDLVIGSTGVHPASALARAAGIAIGETGGVAVDELQRTSAVDVYAVGDGVEKVDAIDGSPALVTLAGLANRHGRAIADAIAGEATPAPRALGTAIIGVLGITAASVGWSERRLLAAGVPHRVIHTHPSNHAGYYPGAQQMAMKLIISPEDRILGAQIVGGEGVDKRIDVIATAMSAGISASGLSLLELAYAPQYGSAKDPINQLGYVAENVAQGRTRTVQWHELAAEQEQGVTLVDVRSAAERAAASIPGSIGIPLDELRARRGELPDRPLIVHCAVGQRGHTAARILRQLGYDVRNLDGGMTTWLAGVPARDRENSTVTA